MEIITPKDYVGPLMELAQNRRGEFIDMKFLTEARTTLLYDVPLAEVVTDFFDELKSRSRGYASMEYSVTGYRRSDLVRLDVKINGEVAEPLAAIVYRDNAYRVGEFFEFFLSFFFPPPPYASFFAVEKRTHLKKKNIRPRPLQAPERAHPASAVQDPDPGRDRLSRHRLGEHLRAAEGRLGEVLRWRRLEEEEAAKEAGGGQEEDEEHR